MNKQSNTQFFHALKVLKDKCYGCTHCLQVCPTKAIRIKSGIATIITEKCVDCGECYKACPANAIIVDQDDFHSINQFKYKVALLPSIFIGQFPEKMRATMIYSTLMEIGFTHVFEVEHGVEILLKETQEYCRQNKMKKPHISAFCPAIVRLIQVRFPSLVQNIIRLKPPLDISALFFKSRLTSKGIPTEDIGIFYITPCAAKIAAVKSPVGEQFSAINGVINLDFIYNKVYQELSNSNKNNCIIPEKDNLTENGILWSLTNGEAKHAEGRALSIDGIQNVIDILEKVENNEINIDFLELRACKEGCAGGVLNPTNPFLIKERLYKRASLSHLKTQHPNYIRDIQKYSQTLKNQLVLDEITPRSIVKLDEDIQKAMNRMIQVQKLMNLLPKIDCGACGAPDCSSLAEDIACQKSKINQCIFIKRNKIAHKNKSEYHLMDEIKEIWGENKIIQFNKSVNQNKMKVSDIIKTLNLELVCGKEGIDKEVTGGYASDLLSDVMGNAKENQIWITLQNHKNILAVASLKDISAIILVKGIKPEQDTIEQSEKEGIPILSSHLTSFELIGKLYQLLS